MVGWARRNIFVPVPHINSMEELNQILEKRALAYREHKILGRTETVGAMVKETLKALMPLPIFVFDPAKSVIARVDDFSTVRFETNKYSVPTAYSGKEVTVKGYGNELVIVKDGKEIARYDRSYERGQTNYVLAHYLDLIEQRPSSVFNAKSVKSNVSARLIAVGRQLSAPKDMVKLLRLFDEYGEQKLLTAVESLGSETISIAQIQAVLLNEAPDKTVTEMLQIKVETYDLKQYDNLLSGGGSQ